MTQLTDMRDAVDSAHQRKTPPVFGPLVAGRLAIGVWMLMFAALGASLVRADPGRSR
ncbi:MAG: hypothetical protein ABWY81_05680 [Jiangellaceae bacterium]